MVKVYNYVFICIMTAAFLACRKPFYPPAIINNGSYLVVEGVINSGPDSTIIKLSNTVNLSSKVTANPATGAVVTVEDNNGADYTLSETSPGSYTSPGLNLDNAGQYRLRIKTADNLQYLSDFVPVIATPAIDSIGFNIVSTPLTGIEIYVNTHDPTGNAKYFRWDYTDAWEFHSYYQSFYYSNGSAIVKRLQNQQIFTCYQNEISSDIVLNSSAKLKQDVIYQSPVAFIASTSEKLEDRYSIMLHQYALTGDAYNFWTSLKTNTEQLGSIFDAQPTQLSGNIHCINNPQQPVIGYVSVCNVTSKRVIITNSQLPSWVAIYPYQCPPDTNYFCATVYCINDVKLNLILNKYDIPTTAITPPGSPDTLGYYSSSPPCVDCTLRGTATPPPFFK